MPDLLRSEPSEGARNLSRLVFDFHADDVARMSLEQASNARKRILAKVPGADRMADGPLYELLQRLEAQILRFR